MNEKVYDKHLYVWVFVFLLGGLGIDRFMRGQIFLGILKIFLGWALWFWIDFIIALIKAYGSDYGADAEVSFINGNWTK